MQAKSGFSTSSPLSQQHLFTAACTFAGGRERVCMSPGASILHSPRATCEPRRSIMRANFAIQNVEEQDYGLPYIYTYASLSLPKGFLRVFPAFYSEIGEREREREGERERERERGRIDRTEWPTRAVVTSPENRLKSDSVPRGLPLAYTTLMCIRTLTLTPVSER